MPFPEKELGKKVENKYILGLFQIIRVRSDRKYIFFAIQPFIMAKLVCLNETNSLFQENG